MITIKAKPAVSRKSVMSSPMGLDQAITARRLRDDDALQGSAT
ncbi:hypothetical protein ACFPM3_18400 [Streptomyces coeruleoprunus]|uniref:Uncharacterized protein n=1 Tax=Streptomyces coeruleoprunus TaxID=285563 RepID=A0ABV9XIT9_9ACTN